MSKIVIETELFLKNAEPYRRIIRIEALAIDEIPNEYRDDTTKARVWSRFGNEDLDIWDPDEQRSVFLVKGEEYSEKNFQYKLRLLQESAKNLHEVVERNKKEWGDKLGRYIYYI